MPPQLQINQIMNTRDHHFNRSTRPLIERKHNNCIYQTSQPQQQLQLLTRKNINANNFDKNVCGHNDFNIIKKQYNEINSHIGFPYGNSINSSSITKPSSDYIDVNDVANSVELKNELINNNKNNYYYNTNEFSYKDNNNNNFCDTLITYNDFKWQQPTVQKQLSLSSSSNSSAESTSALASVLSLPSTSAPSSISPPPPPRLNQSPDINSIENVNGPFIFGVHSTNNYIKIPPQTSTNNKTNNNNNNNNKNNNNNNNNNINDNDNNIDNNKNNESVIHSRNNKYSKYDINKSKVSDTNIKAQSSVVTRNEKRLLKKGRRIEKLDKHINKENTKNIKCVLVGDAAIGKTNLISSYLENRFIKEHIPTASDIYNFEVKVDGTPVQVTLCDTAGQDTLDPLRELSYPDSNVFLLCFSIVKPNSFNSIKFKWEPKFRKTTASIVLVGTQSDLRNDSKVISNLQKNNEKPITSDDAWEFAKKIGAKYIETSSLLKIGVKETFDATIWDALLNFDLSTSQTRPLWKKLLCII